MYTQTCTIVQVIYYFPKFFISLHYIYSRDKASTSTLLHNAPRNDGLSHLRINDYAKDLSDHQKLPLVDKLFCQTNI